MQTSKQGVTKPLEKKIFLSLYQVLADLRRPELVERFFSDIFSQTERLAIAKRLAIAVYLKKNRSYESIKKDLKVSSATIATVQKWVEQKGTGLSRALETIIADEWAGELAGKISAKIASWRKSITSPPPPPTLMPTRT